MPHYFSCEHCKKTYAVNPRLKSIQSYCSSPGCQQSRKNKWEREKNQQDEDYHQKRQKSKATWRKHKPAHEYQKLYRSNHPKYEQTNREQQQKRNQANPSHGKEATADVVKTDTLSSVHLAGRWLYKIRLYKTGKGEKIVKTDTLLVELLTPQGVQQKVMTG